MRNVGRLQEWNDDKGYGFVVAEHGGDRAFVHIRSFRRTSRRPVVGDVLSYELERDARGRRNATRVLFAGTRIAPPGERRLRGLPLPRAWLGTGVLAAVAIAAWMQLLPAAVAVLYWAAGALSFALYRSDKSAAARHRARRIPESRLHAADLLGGWAGALLAQQAYRHKTVKPAFQAMFWITVAINVAVVAWLVANGTLARLS